MMDKIVNIYQLLKLGEPFALARFNDGEMNGIIQPKNTYTAARGDQFVDENLKKKLKQALLYEEKNYWKGIPCPLCFPDLHGHADSIIGDYKHKTYAVVQTNRNLSSFITSLGGLIKGRRVIWVSGKDQQVKNLHMVGIDVYGHIKLNTQNAWDDYDRLKHLTFTGDDVVLLSCGPLAEVLVYEWFKENPGSTFIDVGSAFDPLTRNVWHRTHKGELPKCRECN